MGIDVLLVGMVGAVSLAPLPQIEQRSLPPCAVGDERAGDSESGEPTRWITSLDSVLALSAEQVPGQRISVRDVRVSQVDSTGFWIVVDSGECRLFIFPAEGSLIHVEAGELIYVKGEFRHHARGQRRIGPAPDTYVYAYIVRKAPREQ